MGVAVGAGDALHDSSDSLVVGGFVVAMGFVDGGQGGLVQSDGGHREGAVFGQVGEIGGDELWRSRQGEVASGQGPGLEGPPGGGVHLSGVFRDAAVEGLSEALDVGGAEAFGSCREDLLVGCGICRQEDLLLGHFYFLDTFMQYI